MNKISTVHCFWLPYSPWRKCFIWNPLLLSSFDYSYVNHSNNYFLSWLEFHPLTPWRDQIVVSYIRNIVRNYPASIHMPKVNNRNPRKRYEMYSKVTVKAPERRQVFSCRLQTLFKKRLHFVLMCLFLTLNIFHTFF